MGIIQTIMIEENNKLIAEFIWGQPDDEVWYRNTGLISPITFSKGSHHFEQLCFHESWDWLMLAVQKVNAISSMDENNGGTYDQPSYGKADCVLYLHINEELSEAYSAVIEFINWYNQQPHD
jgi:hypothetical protein